MNLDTIKAHFTIIRDERQSAKVDYPLFDILFGSICAVIAGGQGWTDIREYALGHHEWFLKQGLFDNGVPVDDTFARLIANIDPAKFRDCFLAWMKAVHKLTGCEVVAMACQTKIAKAITNKGGDYLLAVKGNQGKLSAAASGLHPTPPSAN